MFGIIDLIYAVNDLMTKPRGAASTPASQYRAKRLILGVGSEISPQEVFDMSMDEARELAGRSCAVSREKYTNLEKEIEEYQKNNPCFPLSDEW